MGQDANPGSIFRLQSRRQPIPITSVTAVCRGGISRTSSTRSTGSMNGSVISIIIVRSIILVAAAAAEAVIVYLLELSMYHWHSTRYSLLKFHDKSTWEWYCLVFPGL